jgi:hypothetical protein
VPDMIIKPAWVNVEVTPRNIGVDGFAGCLPLDDAIMASSCSEFESSFSLIPRNEWREIAEIRRRAMKTLIPDRRNQGREGACVGNAATRSQEYCDAVAFGPDRRIPLSAMGVYKRIGRSAQSGAVIADALEVMKTGGSLPLDSDEARRIFEAEFGFPPAHTHPATGFSTRLPNGWQQTGELLTIDEYWRIRSIEGFVTALFSNLGVVYGRSRHAICGIDWLESGGKEYIEYDNSWGAQLGQQRVRLRRAALARATAHLRLVCRPDHEGNSIPLSTDLMDCHH